MAIGIIQKPRRRRDKEKNGSFLSVTCVAEEETVNIPSSIQDLESFRAWVEFEEVPEKLRVCFLDGEVWLDMSKEQIFTHVDVKGEFTEVLRPLAKAGGRGRFLPDGLRLTNVAANLSSKPDGTFVLNETLAAGRLRLIQGKRRGFVEIEGTPDMVLEIVSDSSVHKDLVALRELYWKAGIPEYWLVDVRGEDVIFEIYRHAAKSYVAVRKQDGWVKSNLFGKSFRLVRGQDEFANPEFTLEVK